MKKMKLIASLMAAAAVCMNMSDVNAQKYYETLEYIIHDDKAVITGFEGNMQVLEIPAKIDGKDVVEIRENAFFKCSSLKKVTVPETVTFIGHHAFFGCTSLEEIMLSENIISIDEGCFSGCISLDKVTLPDNLRVIEDKSFYNCKSLDDIVFPHGLEEIGDYAFANCGELSEVTFYNKLMSIGEFSFYNCKGLGEVYIPDSVMSLGSCSLGFCEGKQGSCDDFKIKGTPQSLGKIYAEGNDIDFESSESKKTSKKTSGIPALAVIASGAGLLFFQFLEKLKGFKRKYEYEC